MEIGDLVNHLAHGRGIIISVKRNISWTSVQVYWEQPIYWKEDGEEQQHICWVDDGDVLVVSAPKKEEK